MHLLELAKTAWNRTVNENVASSRQKPLERQLQGYLISASQILEIFGAEGDDGGPLEEIQTLQSLLANSC